MAEQPVKEKVNDTGHLWPKQLLLNQAYAAGFACLKCNGVPTSCMTDSEGQVICSKCAEEIDGTMVNKFAQNMIDQMKTKCLSIAPNVNENQQQDAEGSVMVTAAKDNECDWTGMIKEWNQHEKECQFWIIPCDLCHTYQCKRKEMTQHLTTCPEMTIDCPLSCGCSILRKDEETHLDTECGEKLLNCTNDDCKIEIQRKNHQKHVEEECEYRIVSCPFKQYGCNVSNIKANELESHKEEYKVDHLSNQLNHTTIVIAALNDKVLNLEEKNNALQRKNNECNEKIYKISYKISNLEDKNNELNQKLLDLKQANGILTTKSNEFKDEISALKEAANISKQHEMPKNTSVIWQGTRDDIPKGWKFMEYRTIQKQYIYKTDFDENGIIYAIGKNEEKKEWENPSRTGLVILDSTGLYDSNVKIHDFIGRVGGVRCLLDYKRNGWWSIDFKDLKIRPTNYTLRHYNGRLHCLRNWKLEASIDGEEWLCLKEHQNDQSLNGKDSTWTWIIDNCDRFFRYFRIYMTGPSSNSHWYLCCSGFEIYGTVASSDLLIKKCI